MTVRNTRRAAIAFCLVLASGIAAAEDARGTFGFAAKVDAEGFLSPTLKAILIQSVQPGLPAALAGVLPGDSIVEVDGIKVVGAKASTVAEHLRKKPGEAVVLRLVRTGGKPFVVTLTAVAAKT